MKIKSNRSREMWIDVTSDSQRPFVMVKSEWLLSQFRCDRFRCGEDVKHEDPMTACSRTEGRPVLPDRSEQDRGLPVSPV